MCWLQQCMRAACLLEVRAPKPGNVHPQAAFDDLNYDDFVQSTSIVAPILSQAGRRGPAISVLDAAQASHAQLGRNAQMGIILLLAPLAAVPPDVPLQQGIEAVLDSLTIEDSQRVYQALALMRPGGLGRVAEQDISQRPSLPLRDVMRLATQRDAVAQEYATGFATVLDTGVPLLQEFRGSGQDWDQAIVRLQLTLMSRRPDTLIARKRGQNVARQSATRAQAVLAAGWPLTAQSQSALAEFDAWLRADGHSRNPGTTADLVCASLFAGFRDKHIALPDATELIY